MVVGGGGGGWGVGCGGGGVGVGVWGWGAVVASVDSSGADDPQTKISYCLFHYISKI